MSKEIIINGWIKTYLIGAMSRTAKGDAGVGWRENIQNELMKRLDENNNPIFIFNPCDQEQNKVGLNPLEYHKKINGWLNSGNNHLVAEGSDLIWEGKHYIYLDENNKPYLKVIPGDDFYVENSNFLICKINPGDTPCIAENTKILMADWSQKNIQDIKIGDKILGFKKLKGKTILVETFVSYQQKTGYKSCVKVVDKKNNIIFVTPNHKFLTKNKKCGSVYTEIKDINNVFSLNIEPTDITFFKGWITGYLQNDGCFIENWKSHQVILVTNKYNEIKVIKKILKMFNIIPTITKKINKESGTLIYKLTVNKRKDYFELNDWKKNHPPSRNFQRGWIAGAIDADGYYDESSIRYSQSKVNILNRKIFKQYCKILKIPYTMQLRNRKDLKIFGRKINNSGEYIFNISKTLAFFIPTQLPYKRKKYSLSIDTLNSSINIKKSGRRNIYDLTTGTGNFIANGFIVHNCGTFYEAGYCRKLKKPIYVIQTMKREEYPESFVGWVFSSNGGFFNSQSELLSFIDKKYNLKEKKS